MNCTTATRQPRAHARPITPNADDDLPLPSPVLSTTTDRADRAIAHDANFAKVLTLVLGGARSGKSAVAERLVADLPPPVTYLATAALLPGLGDDDFAARVAAHRDRRPSGWTTVEAGADLVPALVAADGTVLVDSLGTWVAAHDEFAVDADALLDALVRRTSATVIVSEEVGLGVHPSSEVGRRFRDALGDVNQAVAAIADDVVLVVAGRPMTL